jgi:hypothetical protein
VVERGATTVGFWAVIACSAGGSAGDETTGTSTASTSSTGASASTAQTSDGDTTVADPSTTAGPDGWQVIEELDAGLGMAMSVWGPARDDVFVVGGQVDGDTSTGFALHDAGGGFASDALPPGTPMLNWVGPAGDDRWTVGLEGAALRRERGSWVAHPTPVTVTLWGVWGAAADDVWAVGGNGVDDPPTLIHFDGATWAAAPLPADIPRSCNALFKVWGSDADHVFIAGDGGVLLQGSALGFDGTYAASISPFIAVRGRSTDDVVAVGGRANARVARFDGVGWQDTTLTTPGLNGVWVDDAGTATLVGRLGGIYELAPGSLAPSAIDSPTAALLHAVHGFAGGSRLAVGGSFEGPTPWVGVILEHPG